jgi:hypothetical protein
MPAPHRAHPQFESRVAKIKALTLVPPAVEVYELSPSGLSELRDDWCMLGRKNIEEALIEKFTSKEYRLAFLPLRGAFMHFRHSTPSKQIHSKHSYGPQVFPEKAPGSNTAWRHGASVHGFWL